jgi:lipoprotein-anchoring transpeptidase ErfK/SrfK
MHAPPTNDLELAAWQVMLERRYFSVGTIDGEFGQRTPKALWAFQTLHGLTNSGVFDTESCAQLGPVEAPFSVQPLTEEDFKMIAPTPTQWKEKRKRKYLGYNDIAEMTAEKFHTTPRFIERLNPGIVWTNLAPGSTVLAPNLAIRPAPRAAEKVLISLSAKTIQAFDTNGAVIAHFPCSIAKDKAKRPVGKLRVIAAVPNPSYLFQPTVLPEVAEKEGLTEIFPIPPGPNNPVGLAWIGLSRKGYGIHGTPNPREISITESHGCFRLANWNAQALRRMVKSGTPVEVQP